MFTIRTATRVLFAAAVLAFFGTAQAAEKPKSLAQGPNAPPSVGCAYDKIASIKSQDKPGAAKTAEDAHNWFKVKAPQPTQFAGKPGTAKTINPKGSGPNGWFEAWPAKLHDKRPGK